MRSASLAAALAVALLGLTRDSGAESIVYRAFLDGPSEDPPNESPGSGYARLAFDLGALTMRLTVHFEGLEGQTTAAHIHGPTAFPFFGNAPVMTQLPSFEGFPLGVSSGSYDRTFDLGLASTYSPAFLNNNGGAPAAAAEALGLALAENRAYLNIHSNIYPPGEIRGFFTVIPEPSSMALAGVGGSGVLAFIRHGRRRGVVTSAR